MRSVTIPEGKREAQGLLNSAKVSCVWASAVIVYRRPLQMSALSFYSITGGGEAVLALVYSKKLTVNHLEGNLQPPS